MYKQTAFDAVVRLDDGACIPADPGNADWRRYQDWLAEGHLPEPADAQGTIAAPEPAPALGLDAVKAAALAEIDRQTGAVRGQLVTTAPGQEMIYLEKRAEAEKCKADGAPTRARYPLLAADIGATVAETDSVRADLNAVADLVLAQAAAWKEFAAATETIRLTAKRQVREAETVEAVQAVLDGLAWPQIGSAAEA